MSTKLPSLGETIPSVRTDLREVAERVPRLPPERRGAEVARLFRLANRCASRSSSKPRRREQWHSLAVEARRLIRALEVGP